MTHPTETNTILHKTERFAACDTCNYQNYETAMEHAATNPGHRISQRTVTTVITSTVALELEA